MIRSKLPDVGTTIFTVMSRLAIEHQAINLGQGFPDFNPDPKLCELVARAMDAGHNQYPYMSGVAPLRQAIAQKTRALYGRTYDTDTEITVTSRATARSDARRVGKQMDSTLISRGVVAH